MSKFTIKTSNVPRNLIYGYELTPKEKEDFDYIDAEYIDNHSFFRYKGVLYDPSEFLCINAHSPDELRATRFQDYSPDTLFSGILIRYTADGEQVICGRYHC